MKEKILIASAGVLVVLIAIILFFIFQTKEYKVTFDTAGGTAISEVVVKEGATINDLAIPKKDGYTFLYWTLDGKICNKIDEITKDMHLVAVWQKESTEEDVKKYKVTFDADGGIIEHGTGLEIEVEEGKTVSKPTNPTKEGYTFVEWTLDGKTFDFSKEVTKDISLKAKWEKKAEQVKTYTVTFNTDGGSKISSKSVKEGNKVTKPSNPTKSGYTFVNWTLNGKEYNFNTKVTSNITLKATWKKVEDKPVVVPTKYTVTFDSKGGNTVASQTVEEGKTATKPTEPTRTGYTFKGWLLNGTVYDFSKAVTGNITLTASWEEIQKVYTVSVSQVDAYSPDRYLTVFEDGKAITVTKIMYTDGVEIMSTINGIKISVASADIAGETTIKVQLANGKVVSATIK